MNRTLRRVYNLRSGRKMIYNDSTLIFFDLETTGFNSFHNDIIEIAATDNHGNSFNELIKPKGPIPNKITKITNITDEMVADCRDMEEVLYDFVYFCTHNTDGSKRNMNNTYLIAHNCISFDRVFLERKMAFYGIASPGWKYLDTLYLAQYLLPDKSHKLNSLAKYWNIININAHRAFSDVTTMIKIWNILIFMWKSTPESYGYDPTGEDTLDLDKLYNFLINFKKS